MQQDACSPGNLMQQDSRCLVGMYPSLSCDSPARSVQATIFATLPDSALQSLPCYSPGNLMQQDACSPGNLMQQDSRCLVGMYPSLSCDSPARSVQATIFATLPDSALQSLPCYSPGNLMQQDACSPGNLMQQDSSYENNRHPSFAVLLHLLVSIQFMHSVVPWFSQASPCS